MQMEIKRKLGWLYLDKIDFKTKTVIKDKVGINNDKEINQHEDITFVNIYALNIGAHNT